MKEEFKRKQKEMEREMGEKVRKAEKSKNGELSQD